MNEKHKNRSESNLRRSIIKTYSNTFELQERRRNGEKQSNTNLHLIKWNKITGLFVKLILLKSKNLISHFIELSISFFLL